MPRTGELISFLLKKSSKFIIIFWLLQFGCSAKEIVMNVGYANEKMAADNKFQSINVAQDDRLIMMISVIYDENDDLARPLINNFSNIPGLRSFNLGDPNISQGPSLGNCPVINFNFFLEPTKEGKFKIGPARCQLGDEVLESDTVEIIVTKPENKYKDFFAEIVVSDEDKKLFLGQKRTLTVKFYLNRERYESFEGCDFIKPELHDFELSDLPEKNREYIENLSWRSYSVIERSFSIMPLKSGTLEILPFKIVYQIMKSDNSRDSGFGFFTSIFSRTLVPGTLYSNDGMPISLEVEKVPDNVSAVGSLFNVDLKLDREKAMVGHPVVLSFEISGNGDADKILHPELVLPEYLRVYESKTENLKVGKNGNNDQKPFRKIFQYIVQAPKPGIYQIPEQAFVYFDTTSEEVVTIKTKPVAFVALADESETSVQNFQKFDVSNQVQSSSDGNSDQMSAQEKKLAQRLKFIVITDEYEKPINPDSLKAELLFILIWLISLMIFFRNEIKAWVFTKNSGRWAKSRASKELSIEFKRNDLRGIYFIFMRYFSARFSVQIEAVDAEWIANILKLLDLDRSKFDEFFVFFNEIASLAFGKELRKYGPLEIDALLKKSIFWLELIDGLFIKHEAKSKK